MEEKKTGQWFVIQALSGQEFHVKQSIDKRLRLEELGDLIFDVVVPTEMVSEVRHGRKTKAERKFFPGYVMVNMALYKEDGQINDRVWYFLRETPGVIGIVGGEKPVPLSAHEVDDIMMQTRQAEDVSKPKIMFEVGEAVTIKDGAFANLEGTIESIDPDRGKMCVLLVIFNRQTRVEVEYWQVERS